MPDDPRDEQLRALLEVEPLDEVTRKRLVANAMRASAPESHDSVQARSRSSVQARSRSSVQARSRSSVQARSRLRVFVGVAAALLVVALGTVALLTLPGSDSADRPEVAAAPEALTEPGSTSSDGAGTTAAESPSGADAETSARSTEDGRIALDSATYAGQFGDLERPAERDRLILALESAPSPEATGVLGNAPTLGDRFVGLPCARKLPEGTRVAYATARFADRDAVVVVTRLPDGSRTIHAVLAEPCAVRELG